MHVHSHFTKAQSEVRARITQQTVDEIYRAHSERPLDLFLSYFYNAHFHPAGFDDIHRLGIPTVNFYCNSMYQFEWVSEIAAKVDFSWHPEKQARSLYLKVGANPVWVQMGADPDIYHPVTEVIREPKACFVGQRYCDRDRWLARLVQNRVPVDIYGSGWLTEDDGVAGDGDTVPPDTPRAGSAAAYLAVMQENIAKNGWISGGLRTLRQGIYAIQTRRLRSLLRPYAKGRANSVPEVLGKYEVVLNFNNVWADGRSGSRLIPHVRLRDFEAPMCRSCYLTGYSEEIEEFYEIGREIDTYGTPAELIEKARFYLSHPEAAEELREAGYRRALRDHTWDSRFEKLFRNIGLRPGS
ncbi:MAG: glycosyltransferase family 1 protein [Deltaproteobacteria bacterium]|nr:glycosyltransferase family 1 protein [Deltaproteobacteria bacterium]